MSTLSAYLSVNMSAFSQLTIAQHISRHVDWESGDGCQRRDRPGVSQNVNQYGDRELADISANMSIEYRPIVLTDTQPRGAQITQDPLTAKADNTYRDLGYFGYLKNWIQALLWGKLKGAQCFNPVKSRVPSIWFVQKLRFSSRPRKVGCQGLPGSARAQPWNLMIVLLYIVLKKVRTNTPWYGKQFDIAHALRTQPTD